MIDLHSHIIPGVDDGARSLEEAIALCRAAWNDGTKVMVATPHVFNGVYEQKRSDIQDRFRELKEQLLSDGIALEILQGAEVYSRPDLPEVLERDPSLTLNGGSRYFLLEFPHQVIPPRADELIFRLVAKNFIPVIVHPERNFHIQDSSKLLEKFIRLGALCQVTAMSVTGGFGKRARECAHELLTEDLVHVIASDAHNIKSLPPLLSEARRYISKWLGINKAQELFETFPEKILNAKPVL